VWVSGAMPSKIFVNYRRDDDPNGAARLRDGLAAKFGRANVFMDVDNLLAGQRFDEELARALSECDVLVVVIGARWLEQLKRRQASGERDYVREEIAEALRRKIVVIPARIGREGQLPLLPRADELPEDIRDLVLYQKHDVTHERFGRDIADLIEAITIIRRTKRPQWGAPKISWRWISASVLATLVVGYVGAYYLGARVPWLTVATTGAFVGPSASGVSDTKHNADSAPKSASKRADLDQTPKRQEPSLLSIAIPNGLTSLQVIERLRADPNLSGDVRTIPSEGSLLPNTYRVEGGTMRSALIERMQAEQRSLLQEAWGRRTPDLPLRSTEEAVILASIVEKEAGRESELTRVAAVFINRLLQRMRLQSDQTVVYGLVGGKGALGRPLSRSDLESRTPYNTYVVEGLPPAPIANPSRAAIEAVMNPARTRDLYFVADGTGGLVFSATLKEHNEAVQKLRRASP
jgi:hypothetical protein